MKDFDKAVGEWLKATLSGLPTWVNLFLLLGVMVMVAGGITIIYYTLRRNLSNKLPFWQFFGRIFGGAVLMGLGLPLLFSILPHIANH